MQFFTFLALITILACAIDQRLLTASAYKVSTCHQSQTCDEFNKCCEAACPTKSTAICNWEGTVTGEPLEQAIAAVTPTEAAPAGEVAFMADAAPPPAARVASVAAGNGKLPDAQCNCDEIGNGVEEKQTEDEEGAESLDGDGGHEYEDRSTECFNSSRTCKSYNECCLEACKKVKYSGNRKLENMCMEDKNRSPVKSDRTYCRCPKMTGVPPWGDENKPGEVASVFKGGDEVEDSGVSLAPWSVLAIVIIEFCLWIPK